MRVCDAGESMIAEEKVPIILTSQEVIVGKMVSM